MRQVYKRFWIVPVAGMVLIGCSLDQKGIKNPLAPPLPAPEDHWIKTGDGWSLHLTHYPPAQIDPERAPVILCHGLSHNSNFWDLTERTSFAKYLQGAGYDVWSVDLRGAGQSTKPQITQIKQLFRLSVSAFNPKAIVNRQPGLLKFNWTVDDHINHDIPTILDFVTAYTKSKQVYWVGHSMGAMIMFAYLGTHDPAPIKGFVAVAPPMYLVRPGNDVFELMARQDNFVKVGNLTGGTNLRAIIGTLTGPMVKISIDDLFFNRDNMDPQMLHLFYYANQEDISPGQLDQLLQFVKTGNFLSYDGKINYTDLLGKLRPPVLQVVGQLDNMVDPGFAAEVNRRIGSSDKQVRIFGRINGCRADYGHDDIILGKSAREDVFPYIRNWLDTQRAGHGKGLLPFRTTRPAK